MSEELNWRRGVAVGRLPCRGDRQRTRGAADVVKSEVRDTLVELEEERERLADTAGSTEDSDLGVLETDDTLAAVRQMVRLPVVCLDPTAIEGFRH